MRAREVIRLCQRNVLQADKALAQILADPGHKDRLAAIKLVFEYVAGKPRQMPEDETEAYLRAITPDDLGQMTAEEIVEAMARRAAAMAEMVDEFEGMEKPEILQVLRGKG